MNRRSRFVQPENMKADMYDYSHIIDQTQAPGAEGNDQGNGNANQYLLDTSSPHVPVDSKLSPAEQQILDEANGGKKKAEPVKTPPPAEEKKKKGFFKRLFGK